VVSAFAFFFSLIEEHTPTDSFHLMKWGVLADCAGFILVGLAAFERCAGHRVEYSLLVGAFSFRPGTGVSAQLIILQL
jgi:hypothetical protein